MTKDEKDHLLQEIDRLQRENVKLRDELKEIHEINGEAWIRIRAAVKALNNWDDETLKRVAGM